MTVKIYQLKDIGREVHMMGKYVGVSFHLKHTSRVATDKNTKTITETWRADYASAPYINFYDIRQGSDGEYYKDDDSPVQGGLNLKSAITVAVELKQACDYIQNKWWESE